MIFHYSLIRLSYIVHDAVFNKVVSRRDFFNLYRYLILKPPTYIVRYTPVHSCVHRKFTEV